MALTWQKGVPLVAGGYLDQPYQLLMDVKVAIAAVSSYEREIRMQQQLQAEAQNKSTNPDIALPPIPEGLLHADK
jgi:hypothetical protein